VNSTRAGWASAAHSNFRANVFLNNSRNICLLTSYHGTEQHPGEACDEQLPESGLPHFIDKSGSIQADWSWFPEAQGLEFVNATLGFDTRQMGLRCDGWRRSLPNPKIFRPWVKAHFANVPSFAGNQSIGKSQPYTVEAAAIRAGLRSGKALVLNFTELCPPVTRRDCVGIWVAVGEHETDGSGRVMRYTIETEAMVGGTACPHEDGYTQKMP
jgi:hypothetical protein